MVDCAPAAESLRSSPGSLIAAGARTKGCLAELYHQDADLNQYIQRNALEKFRNRRVGLHGILELPLLLVYRWSKGCAHKRLFDIRGKSDSDICSSARLFEVVSTSRPAQVAEIRWGVVRQCGYTIGEGAIKEERMTKDGLCIWTTLYWHVSEMIKFGRGMQELTWIWVEDGSNQITC
jgi:hypothetical protein